MLKGFVGKILPNVDSKFRRKLRPNILIKENMTRHKIYKKLNLLKFVDSVKHIQQLHRNLDDT